MSPYQCVVCHRMYFETPMRIHVFYDGVGQSFSSTPDPNLSHVRVISLVLTINLRFIMFLNTPDKIFEHKTSHMKNKMS